MYATLKLKLNLLCSPWLQTQSNKVRSVRMPWQSTCCPGTNIREIYDCNGGKTCGNAIDKAEDILQAILLCRNPALGRNGLSGVLLGSCQSKDRADSFSLDVQDHNPVHELLGE